ncbi:MAG TPA: alpha/beta hydrolase [Caulobacteraceae bacterium]
MDGAIKTGGVRLQSQLIPEPQAASQAARDYLNTPFWAGDRERIDPDDMDAWRAAIAQVDETFAPLARMMLEQSGAEVEKADIGGVTVYVATPRDLAASDQDKAHIYIHGGGWAFMCGEACAGQGAAQAGRLGYRTYSVDYRYPPFDRFPAALDDRVSVYRELLKTHRPENIVISGGSAGGNLAAATGLRTRDEGLPLPAALGLMTPCTDGALLSDTYSVNDQLDFLKAATMAEFWAVYAGGHDRRDPYLSPVYGDYSKGFAPTLLQTGTRDLLLSDTVRLHRAMRNGGVEAELHVWEAMPHGGFGGAAPEDAELIGELKRFFASHLGRKRD